MKRGRNSGAALRRAYLLMRARHGHQRWWPGETRFEVCVGAILTQNTSWRNVERALANLKAARALSAKQLFAIPERRLAEWLRPSGCFNVKARRLRSFLRVLVEDFAGDLDRLFAGTTPDVRERLLAIHGLGPETADCLLLYAGGHARFVVDAYTKRIFARHQWWESAKPNRETEYDKLQQLCEASLEVAAPARRLDYWQDYHAQLVRVGKDYCRPRNPRCDTCPLQPLLPAGGACGSR